jgi:predicted MFS family arabinose efflux permease
VIGMPLGAYVGASWGWRAGFALIAGGSTLAAVALWTLLPAGLRVQPLHRGAWRAILGDSTLLLTLCVTMLSMAAGFTLFSYLVPAARALIGATPAMVSALLAAFGGMGIIGNMLAVRFMDRLGAGNVALVGLFAMLAGHLLWPWSPGALAVLLAALLAFGLGVFASNSAQQARLAAQSPAQAPASIALNSSSVYLGQAAGSAAGGILIAHLPGSAGYASLPWLSIPMLLAAIALSLIVSARSRMVPSAA